MKASKRAAPRAVVLDYEIVPSPVGPLTVVESERGVLRIDFGATPAASLAVELGQRLGSLVELVAKRSLRTSIEIGEYFAGKRRRFDVPVDLGLVNGFGRRVLDELRRVPFGKLVSYGELAASVGQPQGARAVGGVMRKNPIPIVVACHRVTARDGSLGGFSGGLHVKRHLLAHEGIAPLAGGWPSKRARPSPRRRDALARSSLGL
jgi:methylated-DNA-[protein]-cysteine S-methyltransferase